MFPAEIRFCGKINRDFFRGTLSVQKTKDIFESGKKNKFWPGNKFFSTNEKKFFVRRFFSNFCYKPVSVPFMIQEAQTLSHLFKVLFP